MADDVTFKFHFNPQDGRTTLVVVVLPVGHC